jgi:hypothetical protein
VDDFTEPTTTQPPAAGPSGIVAERESFAFVLNVGRLIGAPSYSVAPGHELRRARPDEVAVIKDTIGFLGPNPTFRFKSLWEHQVPSQGAQVVRLPESEWRYFVIAFKGNNLLLSQLERAFDLAPLELEVGFTVLAQGGVVWLPGRLFHVLEVARHDIPFGVDVSVGDIDEMRAIHSQLQGRDDSLINVQNLALQLGQLKALPHYSPLRFLGYFAILESLLTHAPKPSDPYDSITRQVRKKLSLLNNRFSRPIDYSRFSGAAADTIWARMYEYRSRVAHGDAPDFTKDLAVLRNQETALALIKETVKAVIRQALIEPQLLLALREC